MNDAPPKRSYDLTLYEKAVREDFDLSPEIAADMVKELRHLLAHGRKRDRLRAAQVLAMYRHRRLAATHIPTADS